MPSRGVRPIREPSPERPLETHARPGGSERRATAPAGVARKPRMDIARETTGKGRRRLYFGVGIGVAVVLLTALLLGLEPAAPSVDRSALLLGTVERGSFAREVRGPGTLVPEQIVYVTALTGGRVEGVFAQPGETVADTTLLVVLSNPDVQLEALQAEQQLTAARARLVEQRRSLESLVLQQEALVASARADYLDARRVAETDSALVARQLISVFEASRNREQADALETVLGTQLERQILLERTVTEQLAVLEEEVRRLASIVSYHARRVGSMQVTAGAPGILQNLTLEVGQWVQPGTTLARVSLPGRLEAELRIPQTQAREVQIGQAAVIDTRSDTIPGRVRRVDPNVQNGAVLVEIRLEGELPQGARPDLSVDGTIRLEMVNDALFVGRPAYGQANSAVGLFVLDEGEDEAVRISVRLGRSSVNQIEVLEGLEEGDRVVLSDMSRWDDVDRVRIE